MVCEDAPCCGCCGTNIYGVNQSDTVDEYSTCPICGDPIDFCLGHGEDDEDEE